MICSTYRKGAILMQSLNVKKCARLQLVAAASWLQFNVIGNAHSPSAGPAGVVAAIGPVSAAVLQHHDSPNNASSISDDSSPLCSIESPEIC